MLVQKLGKAFCWFLGKIEDTKISFWNFLTFKDQRKSIKNSINQKKAKHFNLSGAIKPSSLEECQLLTDYISETRKALLIFKRNELSLELVVQLSIHLTMVLISQTAYPLESGLQSIFKESSGTSNSWWFSSGLQVRHHKIKGTYNKWPVYSSSTSFFLQMKY